MSSSSRSDGAGPRESVQRLPDYFLPGPPRFLSSFCRFMCFVPDPQSCEALPSLSPSYHFKLWSAAVADPSGANRIVLGSATNPGNSHVSLIFRHSEKLIRSYPVRFRVRQAATSRIDHMLQEAFGDQTWESVIATLTDIFFPKRPLPPSPAPRARRPERHSLPVPTDHNRF